MREASYDLQKSDAQKAYDTAQAEVDRLRQALTDALTARDAMQYVEKVNLDSAYLVKFGLLEYHVHQAMCNMRCAKRELELIQACLNREESIDMNAVHAQVKEEFAAYREKLAEQEMAIRNAEEHHAAPRMTHEEQANFKKMYHEIVRLLHPDMHPNATEGELRMYKQAVEAYKKGDIDTMMTLYEVVAQGTHAQDDVDTLAWLQEEKARLQSLLQAVQDSMNEMRSQYPFTERELLEDPKQIREKKEALRKEIVEYEDATGAYRQRIVHLLKHAKAKPGTESTMPLAMEEEAYLHREQVRTEQAWKQQEMEAHRRAAKTQMEREEAEIQAQGKKTEAPPADPEARRLAREEMHVRTSRDDAHWHKAEAETGHRAGETPYGIPAARSKTREKVRKRRAEEVHKQHAAAVRAGKAEQAMRDTRIDPDQITNWRAIGHHRASAREKLRQYRAEDTRTIRARAILAGQSEEEARLRHVQEVEQSQSIEERGDTDGRTDGTDGRRSDPSDA